MKDIILEEYKIHRGNLVVVVTFMISQRLLLFALLFGYWEDNLYLQDSIYHIARYLPYRITELHESFTAV